MPTNQRFDEELIDRGRKFYRLMENEDFQPLLKEIEERASFAQHLVLTFRETSGRGESLQTLLARYQAFNGLREWLKDEIDLGGREFMRKQKAEAAEEVPS